MVDLRLQRRHRAVVACYAAVAIAATGVPVVAHTVTSTAKTVTGDAVNLNVATIEANRQGSLTIVEPDASEKVVPGVQFTVSRIQGIDLTTEAGWNKAKSLSLADADAAEKSLTMQAVVDDKGRATFTGLPVGVYYVTEQSPASVPDGYQPSQPMIVTLPVARANPDRWDYDFTIFAKGEPGTGDKGESSTPRTTPPTVPTFPPVTVTTTPPDKSTPVTTTTTPGETPPETTTPPGDTPEEPPSTTEKIRERLASTGANVLGLIAVGVGLLIIGGFMIARRRRSDEAGE